MKHAAARRLIVGAPILVGKNESPAHLAGGTVEIRAPAALLRSIVELCDGERPREEVEAALGQRWKLREVRALLDALEEQGVLLDSTQAALAALKLAENPMRFAEQVSDEEARAMARAAAAESLRPVRGARYRRAPASKLTALLHKRRSVRTFSGEPLDQDDLLAVLFAAYGVTSANSGEVHKTVASGGALFPLRFHLVVLDRGGSLGPGVYSAHFGRGGKVGLKRVSRVWRAIYRAYVDPDLLRYAHAVLVVSGDYKACAAKYANRALLYVPLEAGHAVQNALLAAAERGLGAVQIGGFIDGHLRRLTGSPKGETPLSTVVLGAA